MFYTIVDFLIMNTTAQTKGQIFKNSFLETLTKSNPISTIAFYVLMIMCYLFLNYIYTKNSLFRTIELYMSGLFIWSFMEYVLHRWVFHIDEYLPFKSAKRFHYIIHGIHHENPKDAERLFMPPIPGLIISFLLFTFWYLFFKINALAFMAGLINGYLLYSFIHYTVHAKPIHPKFRKLWTHHALHHYKYENKAFGVSSPLWDIVFNTMPPKKKSN